MTKPKTKFLNELTDRKGCQHAQPLLYTLFKQLYTVSTEVAWYVMSDIYNGGFMASDTKWQTKFRDSGA
jgi:hypothetical protein